MKQNLKPKRKNKKRISKLLIIALSLIVAIICLVSFSEKVHNIGIVETIKGQVTLLSEQIQNTIANLNKTDEITVIDVTYLENNGNLEHEHLYKTMYDENKHWEECTVCGGKNNEINHIYIDKGWTLGNANNCNENNVHEYVCSCGYKKTEINGKKSHVWRRVNNIDSYTCYDTCFGCNQSFNINRHSCINVNNGRKISCTNIGRCSICNYTYTKAQHLVSGTFKKGDKMYCIFCNTFLGVVNDTYVQNVGTGKFIYYTNITVPTSLGYNKQECHIYDTNVSLSNSPNINGNIWKNTQTGIYALHSELQTQTRVGYITSLNGISVVMYLYANVKAESTSPIIEKITTKDEEWSRTKPIVINGTENYCNTVSVKIEDNQDKIIFEGSGAVSSGKYQIQCTPEIECDINGRIFTAIVSDNLGNSSSKEFTISKVDAIPPTPTSKPEILGDWAKSKDFTFSATDYGIGQVSIAFNDMNDLQSAKQNGNVYSRDYKFVGDAYNPKQLSVLYKDGLGNTSIQKITINKIDNTAPTITSANIDRNVITITANDEHPDLGEGSGVVGYRYIISDSKIENPVITEENSILVSDKTTGTGTFTIDNLYNNQYVYVAAVDLVGNIGEAKEIFEPISYTIKYNGNGATSGKVEDSIHKYDESKNLNLDEYERKYIVTYNHNYENVEDIQKQITYKFKNWNTKEDGTGTSYEDQEEVINLTNKAGEVINLYAIWETESTSYEPTREGYSFGGWYLDAECTKKVANVEYIPTEDVTLYAKWEKEYTITVDNDRDGHTYNSYQVFRGDYYEKEEKELDKDGNEITVKVPILSNIEWGEELQKEVITDQGETQRKTHGDKIIELLKQSENSKLDEEKLYTNCETAEDVAKVLQGMPNDGDVIRNFTDIVGKYILDNNIEITKGTYTLVEEKDEAGKVIDENYKIQYLKPGYYLVIDAKANEKDDSYSRYLIDVVQDVTMEPKSSKPTLSKKVKGNNLKTEIEKVVVNEEGQETTVKEYIQDEKRNTATYKKASDTYNAEDYDIGFELKSYIPNPDGYSTYKFEIVDILAKGFDYDRDSVKVFLGENEYPKTREKVDEYKTETIENYTIKDVIITAENYVGYKGYFEEEGKEYPEGYQDTQYGKTLILIEVNDLIGQINDKVIKPGQDVFVRYNSKLNGKGEVGNIPNINEAYLKYSNNPYNNDQITQTTIQTTYTYTIDLELSKIAEIRKTEDNSNSIENQNTVEDSEIQEQLKYLSGAEFEIYSEPNKVENRKLIVTITTDELGQALYSSLGAGTYYLKEVKAPEGYNKLREEIEIEVKATTDELGEIRWTVENVKENKLLLVQIAEKEGTTIPEIKLQVENTSGFQLPVTGGSGTIIFTVVGLSIMLLVTISLKSSKKKIK